MMNPDAATFDALMAKAMAASQSNDSATAVDYFLRASEAQPTAGLPQFMLGSEYAAAGEMEKAETALANAARLAPAFGLARYQLGLLQFSSGRAAIALLTWQPLLELPDTDPLPRFVDGFGALAQDRFEEALEHFRKGLLLNTANPPLSDDIEKVIAGIEALERTRLAADAGGEVAIEAQSHVLLSNYQQQGRAH